MLAGGLTLVGVFAGFGYGVERTIPVSEPEGEGGERLDGERTGVVGEIGEGTVYGGEVGANPREREVGEERGEGDVEAHRDRRFERRWDAVRCMPEQRFRGVSGCHDWCSDAVMEG